MSGNGTVALAVLVAGVLYFRTLPLETTRPAVNEITRQHTLARQDVDARLWQDPLTAVARAIELASSANPRPGPEVDEQHSVAEFSAKLSELLDKKDVTGDAPGIGKPKVDVLAVMLSGGPYAEDLESRRRTRYAVLAALNARGFEPGDGEHLGYFTLKLPDAKAADSMRARLPGVVPYEWFSPAADMSPRNDATDGRRVVVLWLDGDAFDAGKPFDSWVRLMREIGLELSKKLSWRIIGPSGSEGLKAMVDQASGPRKEDLLPKDVPIRFYSAAATVPAHALLGRVTVPGVPTTLEKYFKGNGINLVRTITDDQKLAESLIDELSLRGLQARKLDMPAGYSDREGRAEVCRRWAGNKNDQPSHIAIVAEWDTLYGRSLRRDFRASAEHRAFCVDRFSYLRGLDGMLPVRPRTSSDAPDGGKPAPVDKLDLRRNDGTFTERAEGQSQYDYLRRLAGEMRLRDKELRSSRPDGQGIRAIGVLGNDVYDKLLVLKALQPEFPDAIFFTTDLDQRLLHPSEQIATRNLVVASGFGLQLVDGLQAGTPPFRDSYQTSAFLAVRLALHDARQALLHVSNVAAPAERDWAAGSSGRSQDDIDRWITKPRIFEIGRTRAFDYGNGHPSAKDRELQAENCGGPEWVKCRDVNPPGSAMYPMPRNTALFALSNLLVLGLWLPALVVSRSARRRLYRWLSHRKGRPAPAGRWVALVGLLCALHVVLPALMAWSWPRVADVLTHNGKPFVAFEGLSLWPTEAIRLFTILLCIGLICKGWSALERNVDDITRQLSLNTTRQKLIAEQLEADLTTTRLEKLKQMFSTRFVPPRSSAVGEAEGMNPNTTGFWRRYIVQNRLAARSTRTAALVLLASAVSVLLSMALNEVDVIPYRGELSLWIHTGLSAVAHLTICVLVFFVVDATIFCVFFVRGLRTRPSNWPDSALKRFERQLDVPRCIHLDNWIDLQFVAMRTRVVGHLIYYPFIVLSLLLLSRSPLFDDWHTPLGSFLLAAGFALIALSCAIALRIMAERSRHHAGEALRNELVRAAGNRTPMLPVHQRAEDSSSQPSTRQLELLLDRVENMKDGAFAPFSQQPLLKAFLLPFATLGGTSLLDYLALANL